VDTLYFLVFCLFIALAIFWGYRNDDHAEFQGSSGKKKFSLKEPKPAPAPETDEKDTPQANLL